MTVLLKSGILLFLSSDIEGASVFFLICDVLLLCISNQLRYFNLTLCLMDLITNPK